MVRGCLKAGLSFETLRGGVHTTTALTMRCLPILGLTDIKAVEQADVIARIL